MTLSIIAMEYSCTQCTHNLMCTSALHSNSHSTCSSTWTSDSCIWLVWLPAVFSFTRYDTLHTDNCLSSASLSWSRDNITLCIWYGCSCSCSLNFFQIFYPFHQYIPSHRSRLYARCFGLASQSQIRAAACPPPLERALNSQHFLLLIQKSWILEGKRKKIDSGRLIK